MKLAPILTIIALLLASCKERVVLEGNTAGTMNNYIEWFTLRGEPQTCFIAEGRSHIVSERTSADRPAAFRYDSYRFEAIDGTVKISTVTGRHLETLKMGDWVFYLTSGRYIKIPQTTTIREELKDDYRVAGDRLVKHLMADGNLSQTNKETEQIMDANLPFTTQPPSNATH